MDDRLIIPTLLKETARLAGRGMHPDDTVLLVKHYSGLEKLEDETIEAIRRRLQLAQSWDERGF